ncbi:MAG: hypothetical protein IT428_14405 [Planctomycetaceae bacterium]|nr:hypothetical protein [Planctomycetaceae bacterium]
MSKLALAGVALVAAIPGGILGWILLSGFLNHIDKMPMALQAVSGITLLICAGLVLLPPGVLVLGPKGAGAGKKDKDKAKAKEEEKSSKDAAAEDDVDEVVDADAVESVEDADLLSSSEDIDVDDEPIAAKSDEFETVDSSEDFSVDDAEADSPASDEAVEVMDVDEDDFDPFEDDTPKKKKK